VIPEKLRAFRQQIIFSGLCKGFYERGESRYLDLLWPAFHLVRDIDDKRQNNYGEYYTQKKPLTTAAKNYVPGI